MRTHIRWETLKPSLCWLVQYKLSKWDSFIYFIYSILKTWIQEAVSDWFGASQTLHMLCSCFVLFSNCLSIWCWLRTVFHRSLTDTSGFQGDTSPEHIVFTLCSSEGKNDERLWLALGRIDSSELQMGSNNLAKAWIHPLQPFHRY